VLFTLEVLRARHGDCLILHFGEPAAPRFLLIDGGPSGVYRDALRPRLDQLAARFAGGESLGIELIMVSHIDDDHVRGILDLSQALVEDPRTRPFEVKTLWHNAFDDLVEEDVRPLVAALSEAPARIAEAGGRSSPWRGDAEAVIASVDQGRQLRDNAKVLAWPPNRPFERFVVAPEAGGKRVDFGPLRLAVVCPLQPQLDQLEREWREKVRRLRETADAKEAAEIAEYLDTSVYNLSSIVCLAELGGKRILLTGDARGDHILAGLEAAQLLAGGRIEVDVLKLPHHGSDRNIDQDFFERIRARHYVVSGNGEHGNPEPETFRLLSTARHDDDFALHLTYEDCKEGVGEKLAQFFADERRAGRSYGIEFRADDESSLHVDLLDPLA
jgi:hypothetical protein